MKDIIIIGASGFGREVVWLIERINKDNPTWNILGYLDDNADLQNAKLMGYSVIGTIDDYINYPDAYFVCAIGSSAVRKSIVERIDGCKFATLIDPSVQMNNIEIGEGTLICAGSILTVDYNIGKHVIINLDCTVGHDSILCDFVTLYPSVNVSGHVTVGTATEIGTGSQIIQGINVGERSIVGAGSTVIRNIPDKCTAVGSPAKPIKFFE